MSSQQQHPLQLVAQSVSTIASIDDVYIPHVRYPHLSEVDATLVGVSFDADALTAQDVADELKPHLVDALGPLTIDTAYEVPNAPDELLFEFSQA